jgi:hypothetical protein
VNPAYRVGAGVYALAAMWVTIDAFRKGGVYIGKGRRIPRQQNPVSFWASLALLAASGAGFAAAAVWP